MPLTIPYAPQQIYTPNGRLVELIRASGQDAARAAELRGIEQARLWGGIGNAIQGGANAILEATDPRRKIDAARATLAQGEVEDANALRSGQRAVDVMMAGDRLPAGDAGPRQDSYLDANGLFDIGKMQAQLAASGYAHLAPELLKGAEAINGSIEKHQALQQQAGQQQALLVGDLADGALKLSKIGMPLLDAMDFVVQPALATKRIAPEQYAQIKSRVAALPPEQQQAALKSFMDTAEKLDKGDTLASGAVHVGRYGTVEASNPKPTPPKPDYTVNGVRFNGETNQPYGPATPPQTVTSNEWKDVLLDGKPAKVFVDPKSKVVTNLAGQVIDNPDTRIKPVPTATQIHVDAANRAIPGDFEKTGDDFLKTVPAQWRKTVEKIAKYDEDPTKVASMRGGMRETLMQWVNQVNPSYDASQFTNRAPTRKAFTTGTQGKQINNINTALGHIDQLTTVADQLQNGGFTPANRAWNDIRSMFGSDKVTNFDTLKDALAGEVAGVLSQSGATVSGIEEAKKKINASNSPTQLAGYVKTLIPIMGSKLASLDYQFHQAMGENDSFSALSPESKRILTKHGFDPAHPEIQKDNQQGKTGTVGKYTFTVRQ